LTSIRVLIVCPDRPGIVSAVSTHLHEWGANILDSAQHSTDPEGGTFFMRMEFQVDAEPLDRKEIGASFGKNVGARFEMDWRFSYTDEPKRAAILVSRYDHCLLDLLWRFRRREFGAEIVQVISNHPDLRADVQAFDIPFEHVSVERGQKEDAEDRILALLDGRADFVILARYMQILSGRFLERVAVPVINIHHSFLPAFVGADPYRRALERGVKIIGATAHYVTEDLDAGPIIEQDVERVSHRHNLAELERIGRDTERTVLARALKWHIEDRVIVHGNKTFVFE
jgi:formyltetrahydrofolate deformylase